MVVTDSFPTKTAVLAFLYVHHRFNDRIVYDNCLVCLSPIAPVRLRLSFRQITILCTVGDGVSDPETKAKENGASVLISGSSSFSFFFFLRRTTVDNICVK